MAKPDSKEKWRRFGIVLMFLTPASVVLPGAFIGFIVGAAGMTGSAPITFIWDSMVTVTLILWIPSALVGLFLLLGVGLDLGEPACTSKYYDEEDDE